MEARTWVRSGYNPVTGILSRGYSDTKGCVVMLILSKSNYHRFTGWQETTSEYKIKKECYLAHDEANTLFCPR